MPKSNVLQVSPLQVTFQLFVMRLSSSLDLPDVQTRVTNSATIYLVLQFVLAENANENLKTENSSLYLIQMRY